MAFVSKDALVGFRLQVCQATGHLDPANVRWVELARRPMSRVEYDTLGLSRNTGLLYDNLPPYEDPVKAEYERRIKEVETVDLSLGLADMIKGAVSAVASA